MALLIINKTIIILLSISLLFTATNADDLKSDSFLSYLFKNEAKDNYVKKLAEFHKKLIQSANNDCNNTKDFDYGKLQSNYTLWSQYIQQNDESLLEAFTQTCFNTDIFNNSELIPNNFDKFLQLILVQYDKKGCSLCNNNSKPSTTPTNLKIWVYGLSFVSMIAMTSLAPLILIPFIKKESYRNVLMVMIALAIGVLCSSTFLYLIPETFDIVESGENGSLYKEYLFKGLVIILTIYVLFIIERISKIMIYKKSLVKKDHGKDKQEHEPFEGNIGSLESLSHVKTRNSIADTDLKIKVNKQERSHSHSHGHSHGVQPVAWIVIFSDTLHKFIDGVSVGAAFTVCISSGISLTIAITCEEIPHQLGDFAVLVNAGLSYKKAILIRILCSLSTFVGAALGIVLGQTLHATQWVCAVAAGLFVYIGLCDLIPELNELAQEMEIAHERYLRKTHDTENLHSSIIKFKLKVFLMQNIGILTGFSIMFFLALFSDHIKF